MKVKVFGILVVTQIGQNARRSVFGNDLVGNLFDRVEKFDQQFIVARFQRQQRTDVPFGDNDNVNWPERASVMKRKYVFGFENFANWCASAQSFFAIKIFSHSCVKLAKSKTGSSKQYFFASACFRF